MDRTPEDIRDELLVLQSQAGDPKAFQALVAHWQPRLAGLAWRLTGDREAARDMAQEAWLAIVRGLPRLADPSRFRAWACRIVSNKCADWTRRRQGLRQVRQTLRNAAASAETCHRATDEADDILMLRRALRELPGAQRSILSLLYVDGLSMVEIARVFGLPVGTVKSRLHHARAHLRQIIERKVS